MFCRFAGWESFQTKQFHEVTQSAYCTNCPLGQQREEDRQGQEERASHKGLWLSERIAPLDRSRPWALSQTLIRNGSETSHVLLFNKY